MLDTELFFFLTKVDLLSEGKGEDIKLAVISRTIQGGGGPFKHHMRREESQNIYNQERDARTS